MKRNISIALYTWKEQSRRKPILLRGARQIGKTWVVRELGKSFNNIVEINFEKIPELSKFFAGSLRPAQIVSNLNNFLDVDIVQGETLLFFDEIQNCPQAIVALRYFYEEMPELHLIGAGSLLEFAFEKISFPVGRVESFQMYPMNFQEFLIALGKDRLVKEVDHSLGEGLPEPTHNLLMNLVRDYCIVGGMPEVVKEYVSSKNLRLCQDIQSTLIESFKLDFEKYCKNKKKIPHLDKVFNAIPRLLGSKLKYSNIDRDIKSAELEFAISLLEKSGIIYRVYHSSSNGVPLGAESNFKKYKVLFFDTGLVLKILGLDLPPLLLDSKVELVNKGAIAEQFVGSELVSGSNFRDRNHQVYYWHRESKNSSAEVDFIISKGREVIPFEVKSGTSGKQKSLSIFCKEKNNGNAIRVSSTAFKRESLFSNISFYGVHAFLKKRNIN